MLSYLCKVRFNGEGCHLAAGEQFIGFGAHLHKRMKTSHFGDLYNALPAAKLRQLQLLNVCLR